MKVTNIKNIVLWSLVLINVFFLAYFLIGIYTERAGKAEALANIGALFSQAGVELDSENIHVGTTLQDYSVSRSVPDEQALADKLLGTTSSTNEGVIFTYTSEKGQAQFRSGGDFDFTFIESAYPAGSDAPDEVKSLLRRMNISTGPLEATGMPGNETVSALCLWNGQPIFNCGIKFVFENGSLRQIIGRHAENLSPADVKTDMSNPATALIIFLNAVKNKEYACTKIDAVDPGYYIPPSSLGAGTLKAAWRISTDTGIFLIDAVTGQINFT